VKLKSLVSWCPNSPYLKPLGIFLSGFIVAANLYVLNPRSAKYDASWWKVALSGSIAILLTASVAREAKAFKEVETIAKGFNYIDNEYENY
jgi:hypothetical protein